ncbi:MAG: glucose 1-dehydrogenase [bacterium]|jgi:glucose 1-dehydrogenase|nr:glucose 1-dehydrogenase [bacterium]
MNIDLTGKVALISGASRGIGRGIAIEMAKAGAHIAINCRTHPDEAEEVAAEVRKAGVDALVYRADVSDRGAVDEMVRATVAKFGHLDIAVSNAYYSKRQPFLDLELEGARQTLEVTFWGAFHVAQASARQMVHQGKGGALLFISSVLSTIPMKTSLPYNAAKAGINQMSATIANELTPHRIRSNVITPGYIDTPGERQFATDEQIREAAKDIPWKRLGNPQDIGNAAAFLCSDAADYITGTVLNVDGGYCLKLG